LVNPYDPPLSLENNPTGFKHGSLIVQVFSIVCVTVGLRIVCFLSSWDGLHFLALLPAPAVLLWILVLSGMKVPWAIGTTLLVFYADNAVWSFEFISHSPSIQYALHPDDLGLIDNPAKQLGICLEECFVATCSMLFGLLVIGLVVFVVMVRTAIRNE